MQTALATRNASARIRWASKPEGEAELGLRVCPQPFLCTTQMLGNRLASVNRRYRNFAPFVRQTGERKAQTCAMAIFRQQWVVGYFEFWSPFSL
jgi:hypothetical protein